MSVAGLARAASFETRIETLFRPIDGEMIALSPDGQQVAYTTRAHGELEIVILNVENPGRKRFVPVETEHDGATNEVLPPVRLRFLRWATADRLIYAPAERIVPLPPVPDKTGRIVPNPDGPTIVAPIMAVDSNGRQRGALIDARDFQETPADARRSLSDLLRTPAELAATRNEPIHWRMPHVDVVGFLPSDRNQLIVSTHGAYSMPVNHLVDIRDGNRREFGDEWPAPAREPQVFDWFRQKVVGERRDGVRPTTLWRDEDLGRVQRELAAKFPRRVIELLDWSDTHARVLFRVTGGSDPGRVFVYQRMEDLAVEILQRAPWLAAAKLNPTRWFEFDATDGAQLSGYLTWPNKPRFTPPSLLVIFPPGDSGQFQPAFDPDAQVFADIGFAVVRLNPRRVADDRVAVDDARTTIDWIASHYPNRPFDRQRVATLGRGVGGNLAARAVELQPAVFRGGVAVDRPIEPRIGVTRSGGASEHLELTSDVAGGRPESRANVYRKIEEYLNQRLDAYGAKVGVVRETP